MYFFWITTGVSLKLFCYFPWVLGFQFTILSTTASAIKEGVSRQYTLFTFRNKWRKNVLPKFEPIQKKYFAKFLAGKYKCFKSGGSKLIQSLVKYVQKTRGQNHEAKCPWYQFRRQNINILWKMRFFRTVQ